MKWGSLYFPSKKDVNPLNQEEKFAIKNAVTLLSKTKLPHRFYYNDDLEFLVDQTIASSAILGHTTFSQPNRVILSPIIVNGLTWTNNDGIPNNEMQMSTVIHELTHLQQFRTWKWYGWVIVHLPFLNKFTVEKWANENGSAAQEFLGNQYHEQRKRNILKK